MNKQEIINNLNLQYSLRRSAAQERSYANLLRARKNPNFASLELQVRELSFEIGKLQSQDNQKEAYAKRVQIAALKVKMGDELAKMHMNKYDITPNYQCKICNDTGRVKGGYCECYKRELYQALLDASGSKKQLADFADFEDNISLNEEQNKQRKQIKSIFEKWVKDYPNVKTKTFVIQGGTGVGKTFLTECLANEMIKKGYLVSFISAFGLNNNFLKYHSTFDSSKQTYFEVLTEPELLVIDDLGTEPLLQNVTTNYLTALLSDRLDAGKATIITTNLEPKEILSRYEERVFSRLENKDTSKMFKLIGDDLRLKRK
ncbi:MAG: ATP-binding protein [Clostridia bacterium]|nr:ATP-binding protein [Clostridia bacterium]